MTLTLDMLIFRVLAVLLLALAVWCAGCGPINTTAAVTVDHVDVNSPMTFNFTIPINIDGKLWGTAHASVTVKPASQPAKEKP